MWDINPALSNIRNNQDIVTILTIIVLYLFPERDYLNCVFRVLSSDNMSTKLMYTAMLPALFPIKVF